MAITEALMTSQRGFWCVRRNGTTRYFIEDKNDGTRIVYDDDGTTSSGATTTTVLNEFDTFQAAKDEANRQDMLDTNMPA